MWKAIAGFYSSFFLSLLAYLLGGGIVIAYALAFFFPFLMAVADVALVILLVMLAVDILLLYTKKEGFAAGRKMERRFSHGDENKIELLVANNYLFPVFVKVIDELPVQFQVHEWSIKMVLAPKATKNHTYTLRPMERGEFEFGSILAYVKSPLGLVKRRMAFGTSTTVAVYPSFVQMKKYQLLGVADRLSEAGVRKMRKIGQSSEFEQIKEYVHGDDFKNVNWRATARKTNLMVNTYTDEKSQQVYCVIDKGRTMKMPFGGMTLLDYAINASLVLSNTALLKKDRAGLVTFSETHGTFVPAGRTGGQMEFILEALYNQQTKFLESDFEALYANIRYKVKQRSLLVLFTNFESIYSLQRQLPYLRALNKFHLVLVVFFENTELKKVTQQQVQTIEDIYIKTIADKFVYEKRLMEKELNKNGILTLLTPPQALTVNTINKYLEIKARQIM